MISILLPVGRGGVNDSISVKLVQDRLNCHLRSSDDFKKLVVDGICGPLTIEAICTFQKDYVGMRIPDGRIDPDGRTLAALNQSRVDTALIDSDSSKWTQEKKLESLNPIFREKVVFVIESLKQRGFHPKIFYGWRSVAVQQDLYKRGRTKVLFSFHNAQLPDGTPNSYAADIIDRRWGWQKAAETNGFWDALGEEANKQGLVWGGDWESFRDVAHIQGRQNSELAEVKRESGL